MDNNSIKNKKNCSDCQESFSCYSGGCWCNNLPQVMPYSDEKDCLCPNCLKTAIEKKTKIL